MEHADTLNYLDMAQEKINSARAKLKEMGESQKLDTVALAQSHLDQAYEAFRSGGDVDQAMEHVQQAIEVLRSLLKP